MQIYFCRRGPETALKSGFKAMRLGWPCKKEYAISKIAGFVWMYSLNWVWVSPRCSLPCWRSFAQSRSPPQSQSFEGMERVTKSAREAVVGVSMLGKFKGFSSTNHDTYGWKKGGENLLQPGVIGRAVYWQFGLGENKCCVKLSSPDCALTTIHFLDLIFYRLPVES